jgi:hypothetical protein
MISVKLALPDRTGLTSILLVWYILEIAKLQVVQIAVKDAGQVDSSASIGRRNLTVDTMSL